MALWQSWQSSSFRRFRNYRIAYRSTQRLLCSCAGHVRRVWGSRVDEVPKFSVPLNEALDWPGDYPSKLCQHAFGFDLKVSATDFRSQMFHAVEKHLCARPKGIQDHSEWLRTGLSNGRRPEFVALHIPPRTAFFVHQHPGIELIFLVRGSLWEIRLENPAHLQRECQEPAAPYDLKNPQYQFGKREFKAGVEGQWLANEMGSIHQTFTEDEECLLIAVWLGSYVIFSEDQLPEGIFKTVNHSIDREIRDTFPACSAASAN